VIDAGGVKNTATASGKDPSSNTISDQSDDGDDTDGNTTNDDTVTSIRSAAALDAVKTASTPSGVKIGDPVNYAITVRNIGNVTVKNITIADTLTDAKGGVLALTSGPTFSSGTNGATAASLPPGETLTYTASFTITQAVINAGGVSNSATASGTDPSNNTVSDQSDDGDDTDGNATNDQTITNIAATPALKVVKTASTIGSAAGDPINYTITVKNIGNVTVSNVSVVDTLTDAKGGALALTSGPTFSSGTNGATAASLPPGETLTYTASFTITQAVIDAGGVKNTATASGKDPLNVSVTDRSDNGNDADGNTSNDPTITSITSKPSLKTVKTASTPNGVKVGDPINYTITVKNTGNVTLSGVGVTDTLTDAKGGVLPLTVKPTFVSGTAGATPNSLSPGETLTYTASFTISQAAINAGGVSNSATASGKDSSNTTVTDKSDDGDDTDGNISDDDTVTPISTVSSLKVVKVGTASGLRVGDSINYTISVKNTGGVTITGVTLTDSLSDLQGGALTLTKAPTFVSGTNESTPASLPPGETLTYAASFTITQAVINAGGVKNSATASGKDPSNNTVSDQSDDGDDTDGNTTNDDTITSITTVPSLKAVKAAQTPSGTKVGAAINYNITVKNTGNVTITNVSIADTLTDAKGGALKLTSGPTFSSGTNGATAASLPPGETLTYVATFTITQAVIDAGGVKNTATASGKDPSNNTISDQSDDGDDTDGNASNDETVTAVPLVGSLKAVKTATTSGSRVGDLINYTITVRNTGLVTITDISLADTLTDLNGNPLALTSGPIFSSGTKGATPASLAPGEALTYVASFTITQAAINAGGIKNTVTASGKDPSGKSVTDQSDNGNDADGNTTDDATVTSISGAAALKTVKTASFSGLAVGQPINYTIAVKNTGNVTVRDIALTDTLTDARGGALTLTMGPSFTSGTNGATPTSLPPGETLTYVASFTITQAVINAGGIKNTATASGKDPSNKTISDQSDNGNDADGNSTDDATLTPIAPVATLKAVKIATTTGFAVGDAINYTITVKNTGNVAVTNIAVADTITDLRGGVLSLSSGPTFKSGTNGATPALLPPGDTLTYTASFTITQAVINTGGVRNVATVSGKDPTNNPVSDLSDDGDDSDGETASDPTVTPISASPASLKVVKVASSTGNRVGDVVNYTITVKNTGGLTVSSISLEDTLTDARGGSLSLTSSPTFRSGTNGATPESLSPGETLTYTASFTITQAVIDAGGLKNSATATGIDPSNKPVLDISDDGDDSDGNASNDATVTEFEFVPSLKAVKRASITGTGVGDSVNYVIAITNSGNVTLSNVTLVDTLTDAEGSTLSLTTGPNFSSGTNGSTPASLPPGETLTYTAAITITQAIIDAGGVRNTVTVSGKDPTNRVVSDVSDDGDDSDGNTQNDVTVTSFPNLTLNKTALATADRPLLAGSPSTYSINVTNTGSAPTSGAVVLETIGKGLQLNSLGGAGWICTYANGEPLTLPAKGPLTARCVTSVAIAGEGGKATPISTSVTPLPGFLGQRLVTDASVDPRGGSTPPATGSSCAPRSACASNGGEVTPEASPTVGIGFESLSIPIGGQTRITVTIVNKTGSPLTALSQKQTLPSGLVFVADPKTSTNCNGSVSVVGGVLTLSGGTLAAGGSCTFSALVTSSSPSGTQFIATAPVGAINNAERRSNEVEASAKLVVDGSFAVRKSFQSPQGALGIPVRMTVAIENTGSSTLSDASFVDEFPTAPGKLTIADEAKLENTCTGTVTATPKTSVLTLKGGVVAPGGCTVSVMVVADGVGDYLNVIPAGGTAGSAKGLQGKLPDGSSLTSAPGTAARINIDRPAAVAGVFTKRTGFGTQIPQADITVVLKDAEGRVVVTTTTKADGSYLFENLPPTLLGDSTTKYRVEFVAPSTAGSTLIKGSPEADDPSINGVPDKNGIAGVTLLPGEKTPDQNGFIVDPSGVVYDAITRRPVAGARVTLIGPSGSPVPNSLLDTVAGTVNGAPVGANGLYVLLLTSNAPSGVYRLRVDVPSGYRAGTMNSSSALIASEGVTYEPALGGGLEKVQTQDSAPALSQSTRYYMSVRFVITSFAQTSSNGIINNHLPIDPVAPLTMGELELSKVGGVRSAELGDSVGYTLMLTNATNVPQYGAIIKDTLPRGFKYIGRTASLTRGSEVIRDDAALGIKDGDRVLNFTVAPANGFLKPGESVTVTYRVRIGVGSLRSDGVNRAKATTRNGASSDEARFAIRVDGGVFGDEACVIGAVYRDCNGNGLQDAGESGVAGARVYFTDGAYMVSDANGRYSMCGRTPTTQVLKIDPSTLPKNSVLLPTSNRNAGDPGSLFADLKNGELHRADFALTCPAIPIVAPEQPPLPVTQPAAETAQREQPNARESASLESRDKSAVCWDVMIEDMLFETDSAELTSSSRDLLNQIIAEWKGRRDIALEIRGHTDSVASDLYNIRLSARRSRAVREFLQTEGGFDSAQIVESSYGESQPRDSNDTSEGRARNRRVAIRISDGFCKSGAIPTTSAQTMTGGY
jgi:uncharacterized repeat protein (TIGR01451 family)